MDAEGFIARLEAGWSDLAVPWEAIYGARPESSAVFRDLVGRMADRYGDRPDALKALDAKRAPGPGWFQAPSMIGYVTYPRQFGGTLRGVESHLDYLEDLHVRYLHLMPLLRSRPGAADGGYAVADYRAVEPDLGTMDDLERLCDAMRARSMSMCIDLVLNHTAAEHAWAVRARAGDPVATAMYRIYPDRVEPDRFEATLPEAFPQTAPGNFTELPDGRWVWTTFHDFQWDLDWSNPTVFVEMADILLDLANHGVEVFRLDAVAYLWKRVGTNCQNLPEVHDLIQALRACARVAAPAVIFKAEAIVGPDDLAAYLGLGPHLGRVSDMAYHNTLMVQFWSALATRDARMMTQVLRDFPSKPTSAAWATYIRCHDDVGWAITDEDASAVGWDARAHRMFLSAFFAGEHPGSFARGALFNHDPASGDSRVSGTFASMAGLEQAVEAEDPVEIDQAIERIRLGHALILAWDGIPLIYMGDEVGMQNDPSYLDDPALASDSRWLHRPHMDWSAAERRHSGTSIEGRIFGDLRRLIDARIALPQLHAAIPLEVVDLDDSSLFTFVRRHPSVPLMAVHNFADEPRTIDADHPAVGALRGVTDVLDRSRWGYDDPIVIPARGVRWLTSTDSPG